MPHMSIHANLQDDPGIKDAAKACELLHDLMVNALDLRKPGQQLLYRLGGDLPQHPTLTLTSNPNPNLQP